MSTYIKVIEAYRLGDGEMAKRCHNSKSYQF